MPRGCPYHPAPAKPLPGNLPASEGPALPQQPVPQHRETDDDQVMNVAMIGGGFMGKGTPWPVASMPTCSSGPRLPSRAPQGRRRCHRRVCRGSPPAVSGSTRASSDWRSVVARPDIDVIDICTPEMSVPDAILRRRGGQTHHLRESPLARTVEEARAMTERRRPRASSMVASTTAARPPWRWPEIYRGRPHRAHPGLVAPTFRTGRRMRTGRCPGALKKIAGSGTVGISGPMWWTLRITSSVPIAG